MFKEPIDLTDPRYSEKANLDYAVMKSHRELVELEENPTTEEEYRQALKRLQYYFGLLNAKYPWIA
jgi:hypothetical protein